MYTVYIEGDRRQKVRSRYALLSKTDRQNILSSVLQRAMESKTVTGPPGRIAGDYPNALYCYFPDRATMEVATDGRRQMYFALRQEAGKKNLERAIRPKVKSLAMRRVRIHVDLPVAAGRCECGERKMLALAAWLPAPAICTLALQLFSPERPVNKLAFGDFGGLGKNFKREGNPTVSGDESNNRTPNAGNAETTPCVLRRFQGVRQTCSLDVSV
jgi:hypothetical protein